MPPSENPAFVADCAEYLEKKDVYYVLQDALKSLIIDQPEDPCAYLIKKFEAPTTTCVCVISPPGCDRSRICQETADRLKIKHIHVGQLLKAEHKEVVESGKWVADMEVLKIVEREIKDAPTGWVLNGFPRTKVQARGLQNMGVIPDKVVVLKAPDEIVYDQLQRKNDSAAEMRMQQYLRHLHGTTETLQNAVVEVDTTADVPAVEQIEMAVHRSTTDPRGPLRVCLTGPPASGCTTQAKYLAKDFGIVHFDVKLAAEKKYGLGSVVSDQEICALVTTRLRQADCLRRGWVLDGFPTNAAQADFLKKAQLWPSCLVHIALTEEECKERASGRMVDPVTGERRYLPSPFGDNFSSDPAIVDLEATYQKLYQEKDKIDDIVGSSSTYLYLKGTQDPQVLRNAIITRALQRIK